MFTDVVKKYLGFASGPATATIIALIANVFLYKTMPEGQFGQGYFYLIVAQIIAEISMLGTDQYFFRQFNENEENKLELICGPVFTSLIVSICLIILVDNIFQLDISTVQFFILTYSISLSRLFQLYMRITERARLFSYFTIGGAIIFPISVLISTLYGMEIFIDEIQFIFTLQYAIPIVIISWYLGIWKCFNRLRPSYFLPSKRSLKYGFQLILSIGIENSANNLEKFILVSMAKASILDDLLLAARFGAAVTSLQNAVTAYWVPRFFGLFRESLELLISGVKKMYKTVLVLTLPIITISYVLKDHSIIDIGKSEYFWLFLFLYVVRNSLIFLSYVTYVGIDVLKVPRYHTYVAMLSVAPLLLVLAFQNVISLVPIMYCLILVPSIMTYLFRTIFSNLLLRQKWYLKTEILILIIILCL